MNNNILHLDAVLAAAHMLPQQTEVSGILRIVKYCSFSLLAFQRVCVVIETPLRERSRLYSYDAVTDSTNCSRVDLPLDQGKYEMFRQRDSLLLTVEELHNKFPAATTLEVFENARQCLLLPLSVNVNGCHAVLFFVWKTLSSFEQSTLPMCRVLSGMVAAALTRILQAEEQNMAIQALKRERDQLNILVSIAKVAASTLQLNSLVDMVAMDLRRFFRINDVGFIFYEDQQTASLYGTHSKSSEEHDVPSGVVVAPEDCLLRNFNFSEAFRILRKDALLAVQKTDPLAKYFLDHDNNVVCGLSLVFRQHNLGVLLLANTHADVFTLDVTSLLSQIALSVACAVHNAREYASINAKSQRLVEENVHLASAIAHQRRDNTIIGQSEKIRKVLHQIDVVANSDSTVLLLGETGTGKELVTETIHNRSRRKSRLLVKINCAAVPSGLLENELFGHEKGAFTGATSQSKGRFELANGGTLLLDEVGDLPLELQPKLLRILQSRELERLGGHTVIPVDVRLVAATNQNLLQMVTEKRFREDLYYRLNVFPIYLPPLRERREDIPLLAQYFMEKMSKQMQKSVTHIPTAGLRWLCEQEWPGNVRELANVIERAVIYSTGRILHLDPEVLQVSNYPAPGAKAPALGKDSTKKSDTVDVRQEIINAVRVCNGLIAGKRGAAALLGVNRTTLNSRMKKLGLDVKAIMDHN